MLNTHVHADHVTGSGELKKKLDGVSSVISKSSGALADVLVSDGDEITCGDSINLRVLATPGTPLILSSSCVHACVCLRLTYARVCVYMYCCVHELLVCCCSLCCAGSERSSEGMRERERERERDQAWEAGHDLLC